LEQKRRYTDHIEKVDDHDILVSLVAEVKAMHETVINNCKVLTAYMDKMDLKCENRTKSCSTRFDTRITATTFWKWVSILSGIFIVVYVLAGNNYIEIIDIKHDVGILMSDPE
jgi:hypothetical protein